VNGGVGINTGGSSGGSSNIEIHNLFWNNGTNGTSHWNTNATPVDNVVADPYLINATASTPSTEHQAYANDLRLKAGSPALDRADPAYASPFDIDGVCRVRGSGADLGAYEH
jgi:hypothetical protein